MNVFDNTNLETRASKGTKTVSSQVQQLAGLLHAAPVTLRDNLITEILALLNESSESLGVEASVQLMHFLTLHEQHEELGGYGGGYGERERDEPVTPELCMRLRVALSRNLAASFAAAVR